jgi:hypothetical protein
MPRIWGSSKQSVGYGPAPRPEVRCDACKFMFPRMAVGSCRYVRGVIHASDTCNEFSPRRPSKPAGTA